MIPDSFPRSAEVAEAAESLLALGFDYAVAPLFSDDCIVNTFRKRVDCVPSGPHNVLASAPAGVFEVRIAEGMFENLHEMPAYELLKSFKTLSFEQGATANFVFRHGHDVTAAEGQIYQGSLADASFRKAWLAFGLSRYDGKPFMVTKTSDNILDVNENAELLSLLTSTGLLSERCW